MLEFNTDWLLTGLKEIPHFWSFQCDGIDKQNENEGLVRKSGIPKRKNPRSIFSKFFFLTFQPTLTGFRKKKFRKNGTKIIFWYTKMEIRHFSSESSKYVQVGSNLQKKLHWFERSDVHTQVGKCPTLKRGVVNRSQPFGRKISN